MCGPENSVLARSDLPVVLVVPCIGRVWRLTRIFSWCTVPPREQVHRMLPDDDRQLARTPLGHSALTNNWLMSF